MDLEKETLKNNGIGLIGTRRILPKEVYELEEEEGKEGKPKGWLSWFQGIYRRDVQEYETKPELLVKTLENNPQSTSSEQNATAKDDPKSTSILSKILPTPYTHDSVSNTQPARVSPDTATTNPSSLPTKGGSKS